MAYSLLKMEPEKSIIFAQGKEQKIVKIIFVNHSNEAARGKA